MFLPLKRTKLGQPRKITHVRGNYRDSLACRARGDQRVVDQPRLPNLFVTMLPSQPGKYPARAGPVAVTGSEEPSGLLEVMFQFCQNPRTGGIRTCVKFLQNNGTEPQRGTLFPALEKH